MGARRRGLRFAGARHDTAEFPVDRPTIAIGRAADCDMVLPGGGVAESHARRWIVDGAVQLEDLALPTGTFEDDQRIESASLTPGARGARGRPREGARVRGRVAARRTAGRPGSLKIEPTLPLSPARSLDP